MAKTLCPWHADTNPSLEIYADGCWCWVCGKHRTLSEYKAATGATPLVMAKRPPADISKQVEYIQTLPLVSLRGLKLPADADSYFILWPENAYYLRRSLDPEAKPKYIAPTGHSRPLFKVASGLQDRLTGRGMTLLIVEGEINALSLAEAFKNELGICSPGAASGFYSSWQDLPYYLSYDRQVILVDEDRAGALACINLATELRKKSRDVQCVLMRKQKEGGLGDCNEILQTHGVERLRSEILAKISFRAV